MSLWKIEHLGNVHDRSSFSCGNTMLDDWLRLRAGQFERRGLSRVYVLVEEGAARVLGYYAISTHFVAFQSLSHSQVKGLPRIDVPVVLLGRLAIDKGIQRQGWGVFLLTDAIRRAFRLSEEIGIYAIEVHAIDDKARHFYLGFGFAPLVDDPHHLFLPIATARRLGLLP